MEQRLRATEQPRRRHGPPAHRRRRSHRHARPRPPRGPGPTLPAARAPDHAHASAPTTAAPGGPSSPTGRSGRRVQHPRPRRPPAPPPHRARTAVGDVIASAPAPGAPHGLLAKVTEVIGERDGGTGGADRTGHPQRTVGRRHGEG
ncbi:hypothetical protein LT493_17875 [Streptomyces tricolor]|nr:hypothetical protein [Streptomyces tricolor]